MRIVNTGVTLDAQAHATPGYVLFAPIGGNRVYLVDYTGAVVHDWTVGTGFTFWCCLLPNGNLFVNERCDDRQGVALTGSGLMREYDWDGQLVWEHKDPWQHHDARRLPGGGAAYLAYLDVDKAEQAKMLGGVPGSEAGEDIFGEVLREVDEDGHLVWEWDLAQMPYDAFPLHPNANRWSRGHTNTIEPLDNGDYLISCKVLNLLFIVDRSTGAVRWHYQDNQMGGQHDAQMLDTGNILIFANNAYASDLHFSRVWEIDPKTNNVVWEYKAKDNPQSFFSPHVGGCQRLASGNTLVCEGAKGCVFEVTPQGEVVWEYVSPFNVTVPEFGAINWLFRARHYDPKGPEVRGRA